MPPLQRSKLGQPGARSLTCLTSAKERARGTRNKLSTAQPQRSDATATKVEREIETMMEIVA